MVAAPRQPGPTPDPLQLLWHECGAGCYLRRPARLNAIALPKMTPLLLPLLIFVAETVVVTISTMRIIFIGRGFKKLAAGIGFFEVSIWLFAIGQVMTNLDSPLCFAAFAGGFVSGNYLGMSLEQRLAFGSVLVRVITSGDSRQLTAAAPRRRLRCDSRGRPRPARASRDRFHRHSTAAAGGCAQRGTAVRSQCVLFD